MLGLWAQPIGSLPCSWWAKGLENALVTVVELAATKAESHAKWVVEPGRVQLVWNPRILVAGACYVGGWLENRPVAAPIPLCALATPTSDRC